MQSFIKKSVLGAIAGVSLMFAAGVASAAKAEAYGCVPPENSVAKTFCGEQYFALNSAISAADINARDEASIIGKCDESILKLTLLKTADAAQKLRDIVAKVTASTFKGNPGDIAATAEATAQCAERVGG